MSSIFLTYILLVRSVGPNRGVREQIKENHLDLKKDTAYYTDKMEKFEIQSGMTTER